MFGACNRLERQFPWRLGVFVMFHIGLITMEPEVISRTLHVDSSFCSCKQFTVNMVSKLCHGHIESEVT